MPDQVRHDEFGLFSESSVLQMLKRHTPKNGIELAVKGNDVFGLLILRAVAEQFLKPCQEVEVFRQRVCRRSLSTWASAD